MTLAKCKHFCFILLQVYYVSPPKFIFFICRQDNKIENSAHFHVKKTCCSTISEFQTTVDQKRRLNVKPQAAQYCTSLTIFTLIGMMLHFKNLGQPLTQVPQTEPFKISCQEILTTCFLFLFIFVYFCVHVQFFNFT